MRYKEATDRKKQTEKLNERKIKKQTEGKKERDARRNREEMKR